MLLRDFLVKLDPNWDRDQGLKVEVVNRLQRVGYALVDKLTGEDEEVVSAIVKRASKKWGRNKQVADQIHVAYPVAAPILSQRRCPNCQGYMRSAIVTDDVSADYCQNCRIVKAVEDSSLAVGMG